MRRVALILVAIAGAALVMAVTTAAGGSSDVSHKYVVELDNAFGLVVGSDMKVAGVRAGTIRDLRLDPKSHNALVDIEVEQGGFGDLRTDAFCESRPQSLIGEYFLDCDPGTDPNKLPDGARIPVSQTGSTVPADLLADVMRKPYRERFRIILSQLGVGLAARGEELNDAIRRASPALRETDRVLKILAEQNQTLGKLVKDGDTVLAALAGNRNDVARWVRTAHGAAADSAERQQQIAEGLHKLPTFLRELRPTMAELGRAVDAQTPSLEDLDASAQRLEHLFTHLGPFARSSQVNLRSLADASIIGDRAVKHATPVVGELNRFSTHAPELANNLAIVLKDLDSRSRAVEADPRSPGGRGYTGFEAILQYVYDQTLAINVFDSHGYVLKANLFQNDCGDYQNADSLKAKLAEDPNFIKQCGSYLGPNQQGVLQPDPTKPGNARSAPEGNHRTHKRHGAQQPAGPATDIPVAATPAPAAPAAGLTQPLKPLVDQVRDLLPHVTPPGDTQDLLDFLLAP
jgi:ABC-type transporter Mla subunit MlaD